MSDIFASLQKYDEYRYNSISDDNIILILFIVSVVSVIIPCIISMFQLIREVNKNFVGDKYSGGIIRSWLLKYSHIMYLATILCGSSFTAIPLLNVKLIQIIHYICVYNNKYNIELLVGVAII